MCYTTSLAGAVCASRSFRNEQLENGRARNALDCNSSPEGAKVGSVSSGWCPAATQPRRHRKLRVTQCHLGGFELSAYTEGRIAVRTSRNAPAVGRPSGGRAGRAEVGLSYVFLGSWR